MRSGLVGEEEARYLVDAVEWTLTNGSGNTPAYITKNHYAALNMIANNAWERPIYFAVTTGPGELPRVCRIISGLKVWRTVWFH